MYDISRVARVVKTSPKLFLALDKQQTTTVLQCSNSMLTQLITIFSLASIAQLILLRTYFHVCVRDNFGIRTRSRSIFNLAMSNGTAFRSISDPFLILR